MVKMADVQYISDANGQPTGVIIPIKLWRELMSEQETAYLLKSEAMRKRLLEAKDRKDGITLEDACDALGL